MTDNTGSTEVKLTVPLEITIRIGGPTGGAPVPVTAPPQKALTRGAEKIAIDQDYSNRDGYNPDFVHGVSFPLPEPSAKLARQVAPLRAGEPNAERGELKYEHFSIKMNKSKRIALFTATNIDGKRFLDVDRKTGEVKDGAEGETWYIDPRISASFFLGPDLLFGVVESLRPGSSHAPHGPRLGYQRTGRTRQRRHISFHQLLSTALPLQRKH
ncbi:hypothetical protein ACVWZV_000256 [Bradyrhizobium sp. GM5.1]